MSVFLGSLAAIAPLAIDMGLPGFPATAATLGEPVGRMPQTLGLFLVGFSTGPLILGPLADWWGRRPTLIAGLAIFVAGGLGTALAETFLEMLAWRTVQGVGAGVAATLPFAIARDLYQGNEARIRLSAMTLVLGVGPIAAPALGAVILDLAGWRAIYAALSIGGAVFLAATVVGYAESAPVACTRPTLRSVVESYKAAWANRQFLCNALVNACAFATMFAYIAASPAVLMGDLGLSGAGYSLFFALTAAALMAGSFVNARFAARSVPALPLTRRASQLTAVASVSLIGLNHLGCTTPLTLSMALATALFGIGMLTPNVTYAALEPMGHMAGVATAVLRATQMAMAGLAAALVSVFYDERTAFSMAAVMSAFSLATLALLRMARPAP